MPDEHTKDIHRYSYSRLDTFKSCPRKHHYLYVEQLPEPTNEYALKGSLFHKAVEIILKGEDPEEVYNEWKDKVDTGVIHADRDQLEYSINMYFSYYYKDFENEETVAVEEEFEQQMDDEDYFVGKVDEVYELNGLFTVRDRKTTSGELKYTEEIVQTSTQLLTYVKPIEEKFNRKVDVIEIDEVRLQKLATEVPLVGKKGTPSKSLDTLSLVTADLYRAELENQGLEEDPGYKAVLALLEQRGHPLFRRIKVQLLNRNILETNDEEIQNLYIGASIDLKYRIKDRSKCFMCPFKAICDHDEQMGGTLYREKLIDTIE